MHDVTVRLMRIMTHGMKKTEVVNNTDFQNVDLEKTKKTLGL